MQIKTQLNDCASKFSENVVQKIFKASNTRKNEVHHEWMYVQVSSMSYYNVVYEKHNHHHQWSLCSIDNLKLDCSFYVKCLLVNIILVSGWWSHFCRLLQCICFNHWIIMWRYHNKKHRLSPVAMTTRYLCIPQFHRRYHQMDMIELSHKSLMIDKISIPFSHCMPPPHPKAPPSLSNFYTKFYKILLNLFYEHFNNNKHHRQYHHHLCYQQQQPLNMNLHINPHSFKTFCDLSTNSENIFNIINNNNIRFMIYLTLSSSSSSSLLCGIEHHRYVVRLQLITTEKLRDGLRTLKFFYEILLLHRQLLLICQNYEFSNKCEQQININRLRHDKILIHFPAHNQIMLLHINALCQYHYRMAKCHTTLSIENDISTLATSNHKLKMSNDENVIYHHHHRHHHHHQNGSSDGESVKFTNCYQHMHHRPTLRSNDNVKSHLNAILFLIILCIPLLTAASSAHDFKYSTNVVKTKYGPLRGIVLRQNPTIEGYLGVPYGKLQNQFILSSVNQISLLKFTSFVIILRTRRHCQKKGTFHFFFYYHSLSAFIKSVREKEWYTQKIRWQWRRNDNRESTLFYQKHMCGVINYTRISHSFFSFLFLLLFFKKKNSTRCSNATIGKSKVSNKFTS